MTGNQIAFTPVDSIRVLLGLKPVLNHREDNISHYPFDILSIDITFLKTNIAQGMFFKRN